MRDETTLTGEEGKERVLLRATSVGVDSCLVCVTWCRKSSKRRSCRFTLFAAFDGKAFTLECLVVWDMSDDTDDESSVVIVVVSSTIRWFLDRELKYRGMCAE